MQKQNNIFTSTNIQSNISNTITLNSYGNEDLSHITDSLKNDLIKIPYEMIPKMIEPLQLEYSLRLLYFLIDYKNP